MIVKMWGGQIRGKPWAPDRWELFGLEGAAIAAVQNPGRCFAYRSISYGVKGDALYCRLPSGRYVTYHKPRLAPSSRWEGQLELTFEGWNTNPKNGPMGWIRMQTFAGRLFENVVQAVARDIMAHAVVNLERAGYPLVLRVHDELVAEVPCGFGSVEEFETIMGQLPAWAAGWPIRAAGGWRGKRYRKD
jgi:DNA polymerase